MMDGHSETMMLKSNTSGGGAMSSIDIPAAGQAPQTHETRDSSLMSPPPKPDGTTPRPKSYANRSSNRLSLSFPVQPADPSDLTRKTPISAEPTSAVSPTKVEAWRTPSSADPGGFMVSLAAQERRVLELREELQRAEEALSRLKRHFAVHEANKKRAEIKHVEPLQTVQPTQNGHAKKKSVDEDPEDALVRKSVDLERRRAMAIGTVKDSRRKVITGGHTRALSLLSPDRPTHNIEGPFMNDAFVESGALTRAPRGAMTPDTTQHVMNTQPSEFRRSSQGSSSMGVKQMAEDLKSGLWTFMEDLRQATVGDEPLRSPPPIKRYPESATRGIVKKSSRSDLPVEPVQKSGAAAKHTIVASRQSKSSRPSPIVVSKPLRTPPLKAKLEPGTADTDDDWSWDSPVSKNESPRWSSSTAPSSEDAGEMVTDKFRKSANSDASKDEIPWPNLVNLTPSNLKRTASAMMKELERSLSPPHERRDPLSRSSSPLKEHSEQEANLSLTNIP